MTEPLVLGLFIGFFVGALAMLALCCYLVSQKGFWTGGYQPREDAVPFKPIEAGTPRGR